MAISYLLTSHSHKNLPKTINTPCNPIPIANLVLTGAANACTKNTIKDTPKTNMYIFVRIDTRLFIYNPCNHNPNAEQ